MLLKFNFFMPLQLVASQYCTNAKQCSTHQYEITGHNVMVSLPDTHVWYATTSRYSYICEYKFNPFSI